MPCKDSWLEPDSGSCALGLCLAGAAPAPAAAPPTPPHPQILEASGPRTAKILRQVALTYAPQMSPADRERDCSRKSPWPSASWTCASSVELRRQTLALIRRARRSPGKTCGAAACPAATGWGSPSACRCGCRPGPKSSTTYCAFEKKWQTVALTTPRHPATSGSPPHGGYQ